MFTGGVPSSISTSKAVAFPLRIILELLKFIFPTPSDKQHILNHQILLVPPDKSILELVPIDAAAVDPLVTFI